MPTRLPPRGQYHRTNLPTKTIVGGQFDYDSASGTYSAAYIPPGTFVEKVQLFVVTAWSGGGAACMFIGDSLTTAGYFASAAGVTLGTVGGYTSYLGAAQLARGTYYPSANDITLRYTQDASDTQGVLFYYVDMVYLPDLDSGALVAEIQ